MITHAKRHVVVVAVISALSALSALSAGSIALFLREDAPSPAGETAVDARDAQEHPKDVVGLWTRWPNANSDGDRVRFYFFHEKGIGLYRYGKIGLNTTSSFDWHVESSGNDGKRELVMKFRKTGEVKRTPYEVADGAGKPKSLVMTRDPKEPLVGAMAYSYVPPPEFAGFAPDIVDAMDASRAVSAHEGVGGRMWIDEVTYATGGKAFAIYQLKDTSIDGRGVGWHHVGDFDDWSTEALSYRYTAANCTHDASIDLFFNVRDERASSPVVRGAGHDHAEEARPDLVVVEDPRSFGHVRRYKDGGRSFAFMQ